MRYLIAWLRFRGWRNAYWMYDWGHSVCKHPEQEWFDGLQLICLNCGAVIAVSDQIITTTTASSNVMISLNIP